MKPMAVSFMFATFVTAFVSAASAAPQTPGSKYYVDVQGHIAPLNGPLSATMTFSAPVQVGKTRLEAGTYLFTQVSTSTFRVTSEDRKKVYAVFTTVPAVRSRDVKRAQVRFEHAGAGEPQRLLAFYPEGAVNGYQIVSKTRKAASKDAPVATSGTSAPAPKDEEPEDR